MKRLLAAFALIAVCTVIVVLTSAHGQDLKTQSSAE